jgi:hypothetical protein
MACLTLEDVVLLDFTQLFLNIHGRKTDLSKQEGTA